ncbi:MAG: hypothetical protein JWR61_5837 [Ferruginibacter sp.]|nr:hypothetical protein [Ferruginibacter sp.]
MGVVNDGVDASSFNFDKPCSSAPLTEADVRLMIRQAEKLRDRPHAPARWEPIESREEIALIEFLKENDSSSPWAMMLECPSCAQEKYIPPFDYVCKDCRAQV